MSISAIRSNLQPRVRGLIETASMMLPDEVRERYIKAVNRGELRDLGDFGRAERTVWAGDVPVWVCVTCDAVWLAPDRICLVGSNSVHDGRCDLQRKSNPSMLRYALTIRCRDIAKTRAAVSEMLRGYGGVLPDLPTMATNRSDEVVLEVWAPAGKAIRLMAEKRVRGLKWIGAYKAKVL